MAMRSPLRTAMSPAAVQSDLRIQKKERILRALTKLNDRDTQKAASEELLQIVHELDSDSLPMLISSICGAGSQQKVYARKECARALGVMSSEVCPLRLAALQPPNLGKIMTQLKKALGDADSSVREAAGEAVSLLAKGLADTAAQPGPPAVLKLLSDCLAEGKKEMQAAAAVALGLSAPFLGALDAPVIKDLLKKISSPAFHAPHALMAALAWCDPATNMPEGLIKASSGAFAPLLPSLIGQPAIPSTGSAGSGVLGALASKDWFLRRAAADLLRAAALLYGPLLEPEGCWDANDVRSLTARCSRALDQFCRFDKVKEVRETAREALSLLEDLQEYARQGGSTAGWTAFANERVAARQQCTPMPSSPSGAARPATSASRRSPSPQRVTSAGRQRSPSPQRASHTNPPASAPRPRASALGQQGSVNDRFKRAHEAADMMAGGGALRSLEAGEAGPKGGAEVLDLTLATPEAFHSQNGHQNDDGGANTLPGPSSSGAAEEMVTLPREDVRNMQQQLQQFEQQQRELLATIASITENSNRTITQLQERMRVLEAQHSRSRSPSPLRPSSPPPQQMLAEPSHVPQLAPSWAPAHTSSSVKPHQVVPKHLTDSPRASLSLVQPSSPARQRRSSQEGLPADMDAAYASMLAGDQQGDQELARLMQRTSCVWAELRPLTALALLQNFTAKVQNGMMLPKILPWLWRLADEGQMTLQLGEQTQQELLQALATASSNMAAEDPQTSQKMTLLAQTLRSHWESSRAKQGYSQQAPSSRGVSPLRQPQIAKIDVLREQLDEMQRGFLSSPHSVAGKQVTEY